MSYEQDKEKVMISSTRLSKKEVELFPGISERQPYQQPASLTPGASRLGTNISIFEPMSYEEALDIVEALRLRGATTICLEKMKKMDAGRLVDFVAGASAALDGSFHKLTDQVYVFCPSNIAIVPPTEPVQVTAKPESNPLDFLFTSRQEDKGGFAGMWDKGQ